MTKKSKSASAQKKCKKIHEPSRERKSEKAIVERGRSRER